MSQIDRRTIFGAAAGIALGVSNFRPEPVYGVPRLKPVYDRLREMEKYRMGLARYLTLQGIPPRTCLDLGAHE